MFDLILAAALIGDTKIDRTIVKDRCTYTCVRTFKYERRGLRLVRLARTHEHFQNEYGISVDRERDESAPIPPVPPPSPMPPK